MSQQIDEEAVLKSARVLYKSGYPNEAKAVLAKLNTEQAKALLVKMGGAGQAKTSKNSSLPWAGLIAGYIVLAIFAFGLGWMLAPKTQETMLLESINQEVQVSDEEAATATEARMDFDATTTAISNANQIALTQITASETAAVEAATATAVANGQ